MGRDNRLPEWWEEFHPLVHSMDGHCKDAQVRKYGLLASCGLCLPTTQKELHSTWIASSCLAVLGRKEYLGSKDPRITWDYWEVQRGESVVLATVLQRCVIHARASPDVFCRAVQELLNCLVIVVEKGDLFNMEKEIWEVVRKDPMTTNPSKSVPLPMPRVQEPTSTTASDPPHASKLEGAVSPEDMALMLRRQSLPPSGFSPLVLDDLQ